MTPTTASSADAKNPMGYLNPTDFDATVNVLLSSKSDPVITKKPEDAWTGAVFQASKKYWDPAKTAN